MLAPDELEEWAAGARRTISEFNRLASNTERNTKRDITAEMRALHTKLAGLERKVGLVLTDDWSKRDHERIKAMQQIAKAWPVVQSAYDKLLHAAFQLDLF